MAIDIEALHGMPLEEIYGPRRVDFLDLWEIDGWRIKAYGIPFNRDAVRPELVAAAHEAARASLPDVRDPEGGWAGVGFVVVHDSEDGGWVLVDWWGMGIVLYEEIHYSPLDAIAKLEKSDQRIVACVYELAVIDFERRLWLELVRENPRGPDLERYLSTTTAREV